MSNVTLTQNWKPGTPETTDYGCDYRCAKSSKGKYMYSLAKHLLSVTYAAASVGVEVVALSLWWS